MEPNPGPPRARSRGGELLTADITAGTATKYRRALDGFDMFFAVRDCGSCSFLLAQGLQFGVEAAAKYLKWVFGSGELSSGAAGTLVPALRRLVLLAVSLGASVPGSTPHFRALWRLHKFWLLAVPPDALASAVLATVSGEFELGLWECFISCSDQENGEKSRGYLHLRKFTKYKVPQRVRPFRANAHLTQDANRFTLKSSTCSSSVRGWPNC